MRTQKESDDLWFGPNNEGGGLVDASVGGSEISITTASVGSKNTYISEETFTGVPRPDPLFDAEGDPIKTKQGKVTFNQTSVTPEKLGTEVRRKTNVTSDSPESLLPATQATIASANPTIPPKEPSGPSTGPYIWKPRYQ